MRTFKLTVAYDGTGLVGWQRQPDGLSVQGLLEEALAPIEEGAGAVGAGRTDAGVHATGQVAGVRLASAIPAADLQRALNARLPPEVRVLRADEAAPSFHARFDARAKTYEYRIVNGPLIDPFAQRYAWHVPAALDAGLMAEAARSLEGTHDFAGFQSAGSEVGTTVRRVFASAVWLPGDEAGSTLPAAAAPGTRVMVYRVTGSGFLRHMVRSIVGTLVAIGRRAAEPSLVREVLERRRRNEAGPTAPARGLCLTEVSYTDPAEPVATHR